VCVVVHFLLSCLLGSRLCTTLCFFIDCVSCVCVFLALFLSFCCSAEAGNGGGMLFMVNNLDVAIKDCTFNG
jgi:hypothetical protein